MRKVVKYREVHPPALLTNVAQVSTIVDMTQPAQERNFEWSRGDRLAKARKDAGCYDASAFGRDIKISRGSVFNYERDRVKKPSRAAIAAWALRTGYSYDWLMDGRGDPFVGRVGLEPTAKGLVVRHLTLVAA